MVGLTEYLARAQTSLEIAADLASMVISAAEEAAPKRTSEMVGVALAHALLTALVKNEELKKVIFKFHKEQNDRD